jgi:hypothetical protein
MAPILLKGHIAMIPTPTPIVLGGPANSGDFPTSILLLSVLAIGSQVLLFYRRRKLALKMREEKKRRS